MEAVTAAMDRCRDKIKSPESTRIRPGKGKIIDFQ